MAIEVIKKLEFDHKTGLHTIIEAGFKYQFPQSLHNDFKNYVLQYDFVSRWYKQLDDKDKNKVNRSNAYE
jgi:hypothetical protein